MYEIKLHGAEYDTSEKIADMLRKKKKTSFMQDIVPVILEKYQYQVLDKCSCTAASEDIDRALDIAIGYGHIIKCVPQFKPTLAGVMEMVDIIYKRIL